MMAEAARRRARGDPRAVSSGRPATATSSSPFGTVEAGTTGRAALRGAGHRRRRAAIVAEHVTRLDDDVAPDWPHAGGHQGCYRIVVKGSPSLDCDLEIEGEDGDHNTGGLVRHRDARAQRDPGGVRGRARRALGPRPADPGRSRLDAPDSAAVTPEEAAEATAAAVGTLSSHFMLDGATYAKGGEMGFDGMDFYVAGRGGVLGDVDGDVVSAAFVFFEPHTVRQRWESSRPVMSRADAGAAFARCGHEWAREHLPDERRTGPGWPSSRARSSCGPTRPAPRCSRDGAGSRSPTTTKARALHQLNALPRAAHGACTAQR